MGHTSTPRVPLAVTLDDAARLSGIPRRSIELLIADGKLESRKIGRRRLVPYRSLIELLGLGETQ